MAPKTVTTRRRWASRAPRPRQKRFAKRKSTSRQLNKPKVPHKPRLVRRYIRRKIDDAKTHSNLKHLQSGGSTSDPKPKVPATKVSGALLHNDVALNRKTTSRPTIIAEVTAIPNPIPDSGITSVVVSTTTNTVGAGSPLLGGATFNSVTSGLSIVSPASIAPITSLALGAGPSFSALPPLDSFVTPTSGTIGVRPAAIPSQTTPTASASPSATPDTQSRQLSAALVILVSVGSGLLLLGFCIVVKMCHKPRRKPRPTPSLPILKDAEADEDYYETKESPIFGGEERMSAANGPMWNWVQYPHTKLSGPTAAAHPVQDNYPSQQGQTPQNQAYSGESGPAESRFHLATHRPPSILAPSVDTQTTENYVPRVTFHNVPATLAAKRMSRQSFYAPANTDVPIEDNRQETAYTADGHDILKRSKSKPSNRRQSQLGTEERRKRNSTVSFVGLAYDGEDAASPAPVEYGHVIQDTPNLNSDYAGRARVKSGYFAAGTYPRMSTLPSTTYSIATATRINVAQRNSFSKDKLSHQMGNSKRIRDTQALTYALGLASPRTEYGVPSPQPTLYPDDSLSVADGRRPKKSAKPAENVRVPDVPVIIPMDNVGSSDTLMGMNFGVSQMSLTGLALEPTSEGSGEDNRQAETSVSSSNSSMHAVQGSRVLDKPPRVPSPPALPSLAQMGLARNNPEAYDSYRSPTYSLYGLYQTADRKSYVGR